MQNVQEYDIRYSETEDVKNLQSWLSDTETLKHFPATDLKEMELMSNFWMGFSRFKSSLTATFGNEPCGIATLFLMPYKKVAHHSLFYLVVDPSFRNRGVGDSLLKNLKHLAKTRFRLEILQIEIWEDNLPMIHLLERHGFFVLMKQKGYVKQDGEYLARVIYKVHL